MLLESSSIVLRSLEAEDADLFYKWSQDREVTRYSLSSYAYPQSRNDIRQWLVEINRSPKTVSLGICCRQTGELIGYAGIASMSNINRCGEYFILIGEKAYWGKGIGTQVTKLVTEFGFRTLGLHRIELTVFSENVGAIRAYEKSGYKREGVMRQSGFRNGEFLDKVLLSALVTEWG